LSGPIHLIVNPVGGSGRAGRIRGLLEAELERLGATYTIEETRARGEAVAMARHAAEGGDGTVHEVANGILSAALEPNARRPALGVIPAGTGNDFAKLLRLSPDAPLSALTPGEPVRFDAGRVRWENQTEFFINGMGTGIDVEVVRQMERLPRLRGVLGYLIAVLRVLRGFQPVPLRVRADHQELTRPLLLVGVMNGRCQGGGFYVCPDASPLDGRLDLCLVNQLGLLGRLNVLARVLRGTHVGQPEVTMLQARAVDIEPAATRAEPLYFQLDGELRVAAFGGAIQVELLPAALTVLPAAGRGPSELNRTAEPDKARPAAQDHAPDPAGAPVAEGST
jgi:diacylglycerol kinase (ATP)